MFGIKQTNQKTYVSILVFYAALVFNIFLGWVLAKLNTQYLTVAEYGRYAFFMIFIFLSRSFFGFGIFESTSRLLAVSQSDKDQNQLLGSSAVLTAIFMLPFALWLFLSSFFADQVFEVQIGSLLNGYALFAGLILFHTYLSLAIRGTGRIVLMSFMTVLPRIFYVILLAYIIMFGQLYFTVDAEYVFCRLSDHHFRRDGLSQA